VPKNGSGSKSVQAHRYSYELVFGPIQQDLVIHHTCGNGKCVNPSHMQTMTVAEHRLIHRKSFCVRGHAMTPDNLVPIKRGHRCKLCRQILGSEASARRRKYPFGKPLATHCIRGHERNSANCYVRANGKRGCKLCARITMMALYLKRKSNS